MTTNYFRTAIMALVLSVSSQANVVFAATWYVATNGNDANPGTQAQPFLTVQRGINAASTGDTVLVANGTYTGVGNWNLSFQGKNIVLRSQGGMANCTLRRGGLGLRAFTFNTGETNAATIDGFTLDGQSPSTSGGAILASNSSPTIIRCRLISDTSGVSTIFGGGIHLQNSNARIEACTISNFIAERGGGISISGGSPIITDCTLSNNEARVNTVNMNLNFGGGIYVDTGTPTITTCSFIDNRATGAGQIQGLGGGLAVRNTSIDVADCFFDNNTANQGGGGVVSQDGALVLANCRFHANKSIFSSPNGRGGAIRQLSGTLTVVNGLFTGNQATSLGGAMAVSGTAIIVNSTFYGNTAGTQGGGGIASIGGNASVHNSIVWGSSGGEIAAWEFGTATVAHSNVQGGFTGTGNINADPLFVNAGGGNHRLQSASPCRDVGSAASPNLPSLDLDGVPRILNAVVDMGAYEFVPSNALFVDREYAGASNGSPAQPFKTILSALASYGDSAARQIYVRFGNYPEGTPGTPFNINKAVTLYHWDGAAVNIGQP